MLRNLAHMTSAGAIAALLAGPAAAQGARSDQPPVLDADAAIGGCTSRYTDLLNTGEERKIRRARVAIAHCVRDVALENAVVLLGEDKRPRIADHFERIGKGLEGFYKELYGTAPGAFHATYAKKLREVYGNILRDVLRQRNLRQPM